MKAQLNALISQAGSLPNDGSANSHWALGAIQTEILGLFDQFGRDFFTAQLSSQLGTTKTQAQNAVLPYCLGDGNAAAAIVNTLPQIIALTQQCYDFGGYATNAISDANTAVSTLSSYFSI